MTPTSPWTQPAAYFALPLLALGLSWQPTPFLGFLGLPIVAIGFGLMLLVSLIMVAKGEGEWPARVFGGLLSFVGIFIVMIGALGCAEAAAAHFLAMSRSQPDPFPRNLGGPLMFSLGGALILSYVHLHMHGCRVRESGYPYMTLIHELWLSFAYWFFYGPATLTITYYRGLHGAVFST